MFLGAAGITAATQLLGFAASALKTEVFYDVLGGLNFLALAAYASFSGAAGRQSPRSAAITAPLW